MRVTNEILIDLRAYRDHRMELEEISQVISNEMVQDSVQSASRFPYSKHNVSMEGVPHSESGERNRILELELTQSIERAEQFVETIPYYCLRKAVKMYYLWPVLTLCEGTAELQENASWDHKPTWNDVADRMGGGVTADSLKNQLKRYLKL